MNSNKAKTRILARTLFDGTGGAVRHDHIVSLVDGIIQGLEAWQPGIPTTDLEEYPIVCPGFIDMQINGAKDVQFNNQPTAPAITTMVQGAACGGTAWILPTFITAPQQDYRAALAAAGAAINDGIPGVLGLHLEGPFLNPQYSGIHPIDAIRPITASDLALLTEKFPGKLLLTLAPECQPEGTIEQLTQQGVIAFAGHSAASAEQVHKAQGEGLRGVTHLFNAMPPLRGREPGIIGSLLNSSSLYAGIIADGHHVDWMNLALAAQCIPNRLCLVTDAMCTLAGQKQEFVLHGETIRLCEGRLQNAQGRLAGAHIAMDQSIRNLIEQGITTPAQAVQMASLNPATALGLEHSIGRIALGYRSGLALLNQDWQTQKVVHGKPLCSGSLYS